MGKRAPRFPWRSCGDLSRRRLRRLRIFGRRRNIAGRWRGTWWGSLLSNFAPAKWPCERFIGAVEYAGARGSGTRDIALLWRTGLGECNGAPPAVCRRCGVAGGFAGDLAWVERRGLDGSVSQPPADWRVERGGCT